MEPLSHHLNFNTTAGDIPMELVEAASDASQRITDPNKAKQAFETLLPVLETYKPNQEFTLACGMLVEKQRNVDGMLDLWKDLSEVFPQDMTPLRMMMRWYRRQRRCDEGANRLHEMFPMAYRDLKQAEHASIGFAELKMYEEIDAFMGPILDRFPQERAIRMRYIKILNDQSRYLDARDVAESVIDPQKMGKSSQRLFDLVMRRASKIENLHSKDASGVFETIIGSLQAPPFASLNALGAVTFYTGQLGAGGAERQMTRLARAFQTRFQNGALAGGIAMTAPVDVAVRHTSPAAGAGFFLPVLQDARVRTTVLAEVDDVDLTAISGLRPEIASLLELLPEDVFEHTRKLIPHFREQRTQVAYLWQDGGVLSAVVAALLAGVPRIVTSFRGLPPNLRPNLYRPELEPLYRCLSRLDHVTFSANSRSTAKAYEEWLTLPSGSVWVIPNASSAILPDGTAQDREVWDKITNASPHCTKTVMGVFRFDENKRPDLWVEVAAQYASEYPDTRFVLIGNGYMYADCAKRVAELGLEDRIFLIGRQANVGFYLHKADLVLHLARMEGLPNVLIEAHLASVPVLATPAGGTDEVVVDGITGFILPDAETPLIRDVFDALETLLSDPQTLGDMGQAAHAHAGPRFLIDHVVDQTARLFANPSKVQSCVQHS